MGAEFHYIQSNLWSDGLGWVHSQPILLFYWLSLFILVLIFFGAAASRPRYWLWLPVLYVLPLAAHHEYRRFILPVLPQICWCISLAAYGLWRKGPAGFLAAAVLLSPLLAPALFLEQNRPLFPVLGVRSQRFAEADARESYLLNALDIYPVCRWGNRHLPKDSKVLLFREIRGYYLDRDYVWGDPLNQSVLDYFSFRSRFDLRKRLMELGITHVLVNSNLGVYAPSPHYYLPRFAEWMEEILRDEAVPVYREGGVFVYDLNKKTKKYEK